MSDFITREKVQALLSSALECSFYISPQQPGLTVEEIYEAGKALRLEQGEIDDAMHSVVDVYMGMGRDVRRLPIKMPHLVNWHYFIFREDPDYRNIFAFDAIFSEWRIAARRDGFKNVRLDYNVLLERASLAGVPPHDTRVAISILIFMDMLVEDKGIIKPKIPIADILLPSEQVKKNGGLRTLSKPNRKAAYPIVKDIVARRHDGRRLKVEPLDGFADELSKLDYAPFRLWWVQLVSEFRQASRQTSPVVVVVLAAALVEGALTFVVRHARSLGLPVFKSSDFDGPANSWRIDKLIGSAASGGEAAILDNPMKIRVEGLIKTRQRIHAGRMLVEFPYGPTELKPEEARDAETTAELVIGRILEWLKMNPKDSS